MEIKKLFSTIVIFSLVILMEVVTVNMTVNAGVNNTGAWGDNGDGTYNNPVLEADYSDPDIIRVGDDYYLVTSTFQLSPGLTILHSTDLVNWKIINSAVKDITQISSSFNYTGMNKYGRGIWAPCLTYNEKNKTFYIHFGTPDEGFFMVKTQDIYGEWSELYQLKKPDGNGFGAGWDDCGVLWDDNGQGYFVGTNFADNYKGWLFKLSDDGYSLEDNGVMIHQSNDEYNPDERAPEAYKIFKYNNMYYFYHNGVYGGDRRAWLMRSENIYGTLADGGMGTYENPGKYEHCPYFIVEGYRGPCQGNIIDADTEEGKKWYFWTHQGATQVDGRPNSLLPMVWEDGWAKAQMIWTNIQKPFMQTQVTRPASSDEFENDKLGLQWLWNYQPRKDMWNITEREGHLRLYAFKPLADDVISKAGNTLLQRSYKTEGNKVITKIDISNMADGQNAGLTHSAGATNTNIGICQLSGKRYINYLDSSGNKSIGKEVPMDLQYIYLKSEWQIDCINSFAYSFDGISYIELGKKAQLVGANYRGDYIGIYNYNNLGEFGYIDVDYLRYEMDVQERPPVILGVDDNSIYDVPVNIRYSRGIAKLNDKEINNGYRLSGAGEYVLEVSDKGKRKEVRFTLTEDAIEKGIKTPFRMNVGGNKTEYHQNEWVKDIEYRDGYWGAENGEVKWYDNNKDIIYQTERQADELRLRFSGIDFDYYKVVLHFMENEHHSEQQRVFDIYMQEKLYESNVDIYSMAGYQNELVREYDSVLIDDELIISLDASRGKATLCGIEILKGEKPVETPRPPLEVNEVLFGKYDEENEKIIPENFNDYEINPTEWTGDAAGLSIAVPNMPEPNCGVKSVSGKALEFGKGTHTGRMFTDAITSGEVHLSLDYAQLTGLKNVKLVDSRGKEIVKITYSEDSKNAVVCDVLYINGEAIEEGYVNHPRSEHISLNELIIDVDKNTVQYKIQFSNREAKNNLWVQREGIINVKGYIRDIAGIVLDGEASSNVGYVDNISLYSKTPQKEEPKPVGLFEVTSNCIVPEIVQGESVIVDFQVKSNSEKSENIAAFVAGYDNNGVLCQVQMVSENVNSGQTVELKDSMKILENVEKVNILLWNEMCPIYNLEK